MANFYSFLPSSVHDNVEPYVNVLGTPGNLFVEDDTFDSFWMLGIGTNPETRFKYVLGVYDFDVSIPESEVIVGIDLVLRRRRNASSTLTIHDSSTSPDFNFHAISSVSAAQGLIYTLPTPAPNWNYTTFETVNYHFSIDIDSGAQADAIALLTASDLLVEFNLDGGETFPTPSGDIAWAKILVETFNPEFWEEFVLSRED